MEYHHSDQTKNLKTLDVRHQENQMDANYVDYKMGIYYPILRSHMDMWDMIRDILYLGILYKFCIRRTF